MQNHANLPAVIDKAAKAQGLALSEVNLIMPTETYGAVLGEFDKITIETVRINAQDLREAYEPNGEGKGYALTKSSLQSIASALSIQWHPQYTGIVESNSTRSRAKAVGIMRKPNGETVVQTEEKTIDLDVERENERAKAEKNAQGGKVVRWENRRPIKEPWRSEEEREKSIELEVENSLKQKKRFKDELALTGAKDRVIRAFLALKSTYSAEELSRPLAFPRVTTDTGKLLSNPLTRQAAIGMIGQASAALYGHGAGADLPPEMQEAASQGDPAEGARSVGPGSEPEGDDFAGPAPDSDELFAAPSDERAAAVAALREYLMSGILTGTKAEPKVKLALESKDWPLDGPEGLRGYLEGCKRREEALGKGRAS